MTAGSESKTFVTTAYHCPCGSRLWLHAVRSYSNPAI